MLQRVHGLPKDAACLLNRIGLATFVQLLLKVYVEIFKDKGQLLG